MPIYFVVSDFDGINKFPCSEIIVRIQKPDGSPEFFRFNDYFFQLTSKLDSSDEQDSKEVEK